MSSEAGGGVSTSPGELVDSSTPAGRLADSVLDREPAEGSASARLSREEIFDVLSNERRRHALHYLKRHEDRRVDLGSLVDYIAARENDTDPGAVDYKQRKRVYSALRQTHLPKLDECDLIEYDERRGEVRLEGVAREVQMHLEYVPEHDIPWCYHYLGLTGTFGVVLLLTHAAVFPFGHLSGLAFATIALLAFGVSAVVHAVYTNRRRLGAEEPIER